MPDLIDRDELKNRLKWGWTNDKFVLRQIDEMPEADPVKHGRWITEDGVIGHCSNCDYEPFAFEDTLYCPNCGAKMDGGDNED